MKYFALLFGLCFLAFNSFASEKTTIRIGFQATGTLAWELAVLQADSSAKALDLTIETHPVTTTEAGKIALQSGAVDIIISDWIWVSSTVGWGEERTPT
jgi:NitT/TauT family transport system substrate-binding protein